MAHATTIFEELGFAARDIQLPDGAVIYSIARTYGLILRKLSDAYRRFGLSAAGFNLLLLLKRGRDPESFTQRQISQHLVVSPSDMSGLIDRMEQRGLVRRSPGKDRLGNLLRITSKGSALVEQVWPHHAQAIEQMTEGMDVADVNATLRVLASLRQSMGL